MHLNKGYSNQLKKTFNIESLFPNHNTKPNTGELVLSFIIVLSVISLIIETEQSIYNKYKFFFNYSTMFSFLYLVLNIYLD